MRRRIICLTSAFILTLVNLNWAALTPEDEEELKSTYALIQEKVKGPFTINYCTCVNGELAPVADDDLRIRANPCMELEGVGQLFCSAYRNDLAKKLARRGLYVGNIFSNEVFLWDTHDDHHRLAKGFILEKYYIDTHPESKLATSRAYGGISGAEFEAEYAPRFFEQYVALSDWTDFKHYLVQYELQRRFFARSDMGLIQEIRSASSSIYHRCPEFKPIRDLIHNRLSSGLIPMIEHFLKNHPEERKHIASYTNLIELIRRLTFLDKAALVDYLPRVSDRQIRDRLETVIASDEDSLMLLNALASLVVRVRKKVADKALDPEEAVDVINLNISANVLMHKVIDGLLRKSSEWTLRELLSVQRSLLCGVYGAGLISGREYQAATGLFEDMLKKGALPLEDAYRSLNRASRIIEWSQGSIRAAFFSVWAPWTYLFPDVRGITDDIIRSSPLLHYASVMNSLREHLLAKMGMQHHILGEVTSAGIRALNPGLALGPIKMFGRDPEYTREDILALETTNADLEPVAGIITKDEGNAVSHVQLLARSLGVPNAVFPGNVYSWLGSVKGKTLFYVVTPMGRVILKEADRMDERDDLILSEYMKKQAHDSDGSVKRSSKLRIDAGRLHLEERGVIPLGRVRREDSGAICGPKAAFLGELKHHFPHHVAKGFVLPFGVYKSHFEKAKVSLPETPVYKDLVREGTSLSDFVKRTYDQFFHKLLTDSNITSSQLEEWIKPRLELVRYSIQNMTLDKSLVSAIRKELIRQKLFLDWREGTIKGVFIRSDTNVEDLPNFSGAGLNLTVFNVTEFSELLEGIKAVWASPFTYRSFSWRQSIIDDPNLVFPSIIVMEAIPSEKSGVLVTVDLDTNDPSYMTMATAEGVGGTVDGSPAETLLYGHDQIDLLAQYKAQERRMLDLGGGGVEMVASSGEEYVLDKEEIEALVAAATKIRRVFTPETNSEGQPLPWDIEYGFVDGHLYLFQVRSFVGNSGLRNLPALAHLDEGVRQKGSRLVDLDEIVKWQP